MNIVIHRTIKQHSEYQAFQKVKYHRTSGRRQKTEVNLRR